MIAASKFDDLAAPSVSASETDGGHGGFSATVTHSDFFKRWNNLGEDLGHLDFVWIRSPEAGAFGKCGGNGVANVCIIMAVDGRAPSANKVDQFLAICSRESSSLGFIREKGRATHGTEGADRRVHAARD